MKREKKERKNRERVEGVEKKRRKARFREICTGRDSHGRNGPRYGREVERFWSRREMDRR